MDNSITKDKFHTFLHYENWFICSCEVAFLREGDYYYIDSGSCNLLHFFFRMTLLWLQMYWNCCWNLCSWLVSPSLFLAMPILSWLWIFMEAQCSVLEQVKIYRPGRKPPLFKKKPLQLLRIFCKSSVWVFFPVKLLLKSVT